MMRGIKCWKVFLRTEKMFKIDGKKIGIKKDRGWQFSLILRDFLQRSFWKFKGCFYYEMGKNEYAKRWINGL